MSDADTGVMPENRDGCKSEWRCFHCGEVFTNECSARDHFGRDETYQAACIIKAGAETSLVQALRRAEEAADDAIQAMQTESTDAARAYHAQRCRHSQSLILAEELGYERGLRDARSGIAEAAKIMETLAAGTIPYDITEPYSMITGARKMALEARRILGAPMD